MQTSHLTLAELSTLRDALIVERQNAPEHEVGFIATELATLDRVIVLRRSQEARISRAARFAYKQR